MSDLMKQLDKLHRMRIVKSAIPDSVLGVTLRDSKRGPLVRFEQVKTVVGQWVADNFDLFAAQAEVTRLREALKPFAEAFEKHGKFIYDHIQGDTELIDINDHNQIHPRGTTMGDYRRAFEALAHKDPS